MQIKNILRYKMLINWSYIIGYLLVTPLYAYSFTPTATCGGS